MNEPATPRSYALLHGFMQSPAAWEPLRAALPSDARVCCPTLLGHGTTPSAACFDDEVDRLARELRELPRCDLVGYSLGARVALRLAIKYPQLFRRVTLIGVHPGIDDEVEREGRALLDEARAKSLVQDGIEAFVDAWEREPLFATQSRVDAGVRARHRAMRLTHQPEALAQSLRVMGLGRMPPQGPALTNLEVPVDLVVGAEDVRFRGIALRMAEELPRCRIHVVPHTGHDVPLEAPAALARIVVKEWP